MGDKSAIEWTDATWNPVTGCSKVSPGCAHCYAETLALTRLRGKPGYPGLPWTPENAAVNVTLRDDRLSQPLRWRRPRRIFVNSLSDLFHEQVPEAFLTAIFAVMAAAHGHTFQVLTKRPERMANWARMVGRWNPRYRQLELEGAAAEYGVDLSCAPEWPLPNVWLGTSVENQHWADVRIPELLATPAAVRFLSMEPLLGHVRLTGIPDPAGRFDAERPGWYDPLGGRSYDVEGDYGIRGPRLDWVIVGGESGPGHRAMDPAWARSLRDQCTAASVPFLFKQWGGRTSKAGGRELDGRTWDEYPEGAS